MVFAMKIITCPTIYRLYQQKQNLKVVPKVVMLNSYSALQKSRRFISTALEEIKKVWGH